MSTRLAVALAILASTPACFDDDNANNVVIDTGDPVAETVDLGHNNGTLVAATVGDELGDDDYTTMLGKAAGILAQINESELTTSSFALNIAVDGDTLDFASELIDEHSVLKEDLDATVRFYGVPYIISDAQMQLALETSASMSLLRSTTRNDFDFVFTELQVKMLAEYQVVLDTLGVLVGPGEMGDYISRAQDELDDNLEEAQDHLADFFD